MLWPASKLTWGAGTQNMEESSPAYASKSNGFTERAIQTLEGQLRQLTAAFEKHLGMTIPLGSHILPLMIEHASTLLNLFEVWTISRTPYKRLRSKQMHPPLIEFEECVQFMPLETRMRGKIANLTVDGV